MTPRPSGAQQEESAVSAFDDFEVAYNRVKSNVVGGRHLSKMLKAICDASEFADDDVQRAAHTAIVRIGDAIEEQGLLFLLTAENNEALPADYREKAQEGIDALRELMRLRGGARD
jgi:hypothetical protein